MSRTACRDDASFSPQRGIGPVTRTFDIPGVRRFRRDLMHTAFEVILAPGPDSAKAEQAAHEAFRTAENLESEFSSFLPNSDVSRVSRLGSGQSVRVSLDTFECLRRGLELQRMTGGAFDMTAGTGREGPESTRSGKRRNGETGKRRARAHRTRIVLDTENLEVRVTESVTLDLGGIGKGYAVDRMIDVLKEWDIDAALVHGGQSAVAAFGRPEGLSGWPVTLRRPAGCPVSGIPGAESEIRIRRMKLSDRAMAASGLEKGPHIIDPRIGYPVTVRIAAWAFADDAATADGLSTAFMVMEPEAVRSFCERHPSVSAITIGKDGAVREYGEP
ncbi:FAD:protein FMN transferase [bacterium]|nr:FAD:protein FMN transferase [bacterium]